MIVLVADDNADMRAYLERLLSEAGWQVAAAADGEEAFARVRELHPDLVVADVMMPRIEGFELVRRIRSDRDLRALPIVLVTARANESAAVEGLVAGANDYIAKPFTGRELVARLGAQIQLARVRGRTERLDAFRVRLFEALDGLTDPLEIEGTACRIVGEWLGVAHAVYGEFEDDGATLVIRRDYHAKGQPSRAGRYPIETYGQRFLDVMREGQLLAVPDMEEDPGFDEPARANWRAAGIRAALSVPVVEAGKTVTYIGLSSQSPRVFSDLEIAIVSETAFRTREAIRRARAEAALHLSQKQSVFRGTVTAFRDVSARRQAGAAVRESEKRYRQLIDAIDDAMCLLEPVMDDAGRVSDYRWLAVNRAHEKLIGMSREERVGRLRSAGHFGLDSWFLDLLTTVVVTGRPLRGSYYSNAIDRQVWYGIFPQGSDRIVAVFSDPALRPNTANRSSSSTKLSIKTRRTVSDPPRPSQHRAEPQRSANKRRPKKR